MMNGSLGEASADSKNCALCANQGRAYPVGGWQTAICETCISLKQLTAFTVRDLRIPEHRIPTQAVDLQDASLEGAHSSVCGMWQRR